LTPPPGCPLPSPSPARRLIAWPSSVAGALLTDFVSFMGQIHWTPGIAKVDHWETGQAFMGAFWSGSATT